MFGFFKKKEVKQEPKGPTEWVYMGDGMMMEDTRSLKDKMADAHRENLAKLANIKTTNRSTPSSSSLNTRSEERRSSSPGIDTSIYVAASYVSDSGYSDSSSSCSSSSSSCD